MKELTKAEDQLMQILWQIEQGFVKEIIEYYPEPKPAYNTVSTIVRILEQKGFVGHKAYGKSHQYFALIDKDEYKKGYFKSFLNDYFGNSFQQMVSFFAKEKEISTEDMEEMLKMLKEEVDNKDKSND